MVAIFQTTFWNGFSWMKIYEFRLKFHWSLFLRAQLTIYQNWFRKWLGADQATSHYLNQWWLIYWHIYASLGLNELRRLVNSSPTRPTYIFLKLSSHSWLKQTFNMVSPCSTWPLLPIALRWITFWFRACIDNYCSIHIGMLVKDTTAHDCFIFWWKFLYW